MSKLSNFYLSILFLLPLAIWKEVKNRAEWEKSIKEAKVCI